MSNKRIAIPSDGEGGISGVRSEHFGHCDVFTLVDVEKGEIKSEATLDNISHGQGGCMVPVNLLAQNDVNAIIVAGIGIRPLTGFHNAGIEVYFDTVNSNIKTVVEKLMNDELKKISLDEACNDGGNCR